MADLEYELAHDHIWSCPGCWSWQLHVTEIVRMGWDRKAFDTMVEDLIREHVGQECTAPRLVFELWRIAGGPR